MAGCAGSGQKRAGCECLFQQLTKKQGVDTEAKFKRLAKDVQAAAKAGNAAALPPKFRKAVLACRTRLG